MMDIEEMSEAEEEQFWKKLLGEQRYEEFVAKKYEPVASWYQTMDHLLYLDEDCSYRAGYVRGSLIEPLYHLYQDRIVGVKINRFSHVASMSVVEALLPRMSLPLRWHFKLEKWRHKKIKRLKWLWKKFLERRFAAPANGWHYATPPK